jgi:PAS domain S-box-containing protein
MSSGSVLAINSDDRAPQLKSVEAEAIGRLRLATAVSLLAETILPVVEATLFARPDWLAIRIQAIWFVLTIVLLAATWHPRFGLVWKPAVLLFSAGLIVSAGVLSVEGASLAPFMFLLVLLPVGGTILPWEPKWQAGMSTLCLVGGLVFSIQFDWHNHLVISGLSAMIASILGSHLVSARLARQRDNINRSLEDLTRTEEKFRKIFATSGSLIAIHAIPDGSIIDVNPAWERTFGYSRGEVVGKQPEPLGFTPDPATFVEWIGKLTIGDAGAQQVPVVLRAHKGEPVHCVYSWTTLELNGRDCVLIAGQDITARVEAEEALRLNRQVLANQERLKTVGELASGITHDLNNSLNALRLRVELLSGDEALLSRHHATLELISRIVRDAASTIGRVQDFARGADDRPLERVDLNTIIAQSVEIAKSTLEERNSFSGRSIRVEMDLPGLPLILGEAAELRQTFLNLLLNAQSAMPTGGTVRIAGGVQGDTIVVRVEDEGHGIPEENLGRIFDPFFSTKGQHGSGLGLSSASATMARVGGAISAANRPQGGAVFSLNFPTTHSRANHITQDYSPNIEPRRVMVIDDDLDNLQALSELLEWKGHTVTRMRSSIKGLEQLTYSSFDVVFCDLGMPELNGWEVAQRIKCHKDAPAFYLLTGWGSEIRADKSCQDIVDGIIQKPVDPITLDRVLAETSGQYRRAKGPVNAAS